MPQSRIPVIILLLFIVFDALLWYEVAFAKPTNRAEMYFLDIGQGDSELLVLPDGVKILTDAGPDASVASDLEKLFPGDHSIDIAIITHPQLDHFNGYSTLIKGFHIGAFITNGRDDDPGVSAWSALMNAIKEKRIPLIVLGARSKIFYGSSTIDFLSPDSEYVQSGELNDTGFVEHITTPGFTALLTADTGMNIEQYLISHISKNEHISLKSDILKVGHHGSKYSSSDQFLEAVDPKVAVIEVGVKNRYGHPAPVTLARLVSSTTAKVFRTDQNGTVHVYAEDGILKVFKEK